MYVDAVYRDGHLFRSYENISYRPGCCPGAASDERHAGIHRTTAGGNGAQRPASDAVYQMAERRGAFGFRHINCQWPECLFRSDTGFFIYTYHRTARNDH